MYDILVNDASYMYWFYYDNNWVSSDYIQSSQYGILRLGNFGKKNLNVMRLGNLLGYGHGIP